MGSIALNEKKVAIVTGATSGIGSWLAEHLHKHNYHVALCGRREKEGQAVAASLDVSAQSATFIQCDVSSYSSQTNLFETVWKKWGRLDVVICNAGTVDRDSKYNFARRATGIDDLPNEPDTACTDIDYKGTIFATTLATHFMRHNPGGKGGKIIVTGSMIGILPCPTFPEYCGAKAAVHQWVKTVGPLLREKENITVNCVMPGGVDTPAFPGFSAAFLPDQLTLPSTLMSAYDLFINDTENTKSGQTIEAARDTLFTWGHPGYKSGAFSQRTERVYEPWFEMVHGERSGLPDALQGPPTGNRIIAVTGATGSQGGGVVNIMRNAPGWKVRAVTRNPSGEAAQKLAADGIEVVQANFDDERSLSKAFEGAHSIFAVTNWWEHLFQGKSQTEAGEIEEEQGMKIARAAAASTTLEHYIWSTTPSAKRMIKGQEKLLTPHMDYKANVDARIKAELPRLAAMTTYLYFGYYPQNMAFFPLIKPIEYPGNGQWVQTLPTKPDASVLLAGDMTVNPGIWVRQVLSTGVKAYTKYANVALEKWTFQEMIDEWSTITGKKGVLIETTAEAWTKLWGPAGNELSLQFKFGELCDPWEETQDHISPEDLGIDRNEVIGFRSTIEKLKHMF